ncbi:MAG: glycosyltransferase family 4 protein [Ignavibacteria bacterium]|jgi:glycosyltransferase involved in cell wall biosynthesis
MLNNKDVKILHIITLFSVGGATENTIFTCEGLIKKGYKVDLITGPNISSEGSMFETTEKMGIPVYTFNNLKRQISLFSDFVVLIQLTSFIKKNRYHIVHTHSTKAGVLGRIAAWLARTPIIIHHNHANPYHRFQSFFVRNFYKLAEKFAGYFCDIIASVTHTIVKEMVKDNLAPREKFRVIRSGFDIEKFRHFDNSNDNLVKKKYGITKDNILIGKIARLSVIKGHIYLLKAFEKVSKEIPNAKLILIGSGENKELLEQFINEKKLNEKVIFTGLIPPDEIPSIISILDIVAHTALLEGLPRVFTQSMLMGKPVIAFDLDGAHEVIEDGKNGYLIEPLNINMLSDRIIELVSDISKAREFGNYAKNNIKDDFTIEAMVENNHKLYQELINKKLLN